VSLVIPWLVAAGVFAATALAGALLMHEPARAVSPTAVRPSVGRTTLEGLAAVAGSRVLLLIGVLTMAGAFAGVPLFMTWQPRLEALTGQKPWLFGWVLAAINVAGLLGSAIVPRLLRSVRREVVLAVAATWRAFFLAVSATATSVKPMVASFVLEEAGLGLSDPVLVAWTNEHIPAEKRATVLSIRSTFFTLGGASGLMTLGLLARSHGIPVAWLVSAAIQALLAAGYLALGRVARGVAVAGATVDARAANASAEAVEAMAAKEGVAAGLPRV
jgi:predicted MFS family arabinose efflux permease